MKLADRYYNPDPLIRLIGPTNESEILIKNKSVKALIDSGAQFSGILLKLVKQLKLPIQQLDHLLDIEGSGGIEDPYYGYVEARLKIPEIDEMNEDLLFWLCLIQSTQKEFQYHFAHCILQDVWKCLKINILEIFQSHGNMPYS